MEREQKNLWGAFFFVPLIYDLIIKLLGVIGDAQTAYSLIEIESVTINWAVFAHYTAIAGVIWLLFVNWDLLTKHLEKRKQKLAAEAKRLEQIEKEKIADCRMPISKAYDYLLRKSTYASSLARTKGWQNKIFSALESKILNKDIRSIGIYEDELEHRDMAPSQNDSIKAFITEGGDLMVAFLFKNGKKQPEAEHKKYVSILIDERDLIKHFPS